MTDQIDEKEKNNQMMIRILSQIVEFRNGESGLHVQHINVTDRAAAGAACSENRMLQPGMVRTVCDHTGIRPA